MSAARAISLLAEAQHADVALTEKMSMLRLAAGLHDWEATEVIRADAVAAFEAMLDKSIAVQKETARG